MNNPQVVICISGGVIQEIFTSDRDTGIVLLDWDAERTTAHDPAVVSVHLADRNKLVRVIDFTPQPLAELAGTDAELAVEAAFEEGVLHEPSC